MSGSRRLGVAAALVAGEVVPGDVSVADGSVEAVGLSPVGSGGGRVGLAVPGFVDWQVNGFGGVQFADADVDGYRVAAAALARAGIVWAAPTLFSLPIEGYGAALGLLAEVRGGGVADGCGFTGAHLEGPFLSSTWKGAHREETFLDGDEAVVERLLAAGPVGLVTLAPERPGISEVIHRLAGAGVAVSIGHSDATSGQCRAAVATGARAITHCWNAHRRFTPRDPGPAGWALAAPGVTVGLIGDGIHVAPETVALTFTAAAGRVALTTDAIAPAGTDLDRWGPSGEVTVSGCAARLADGTLAGSVATPTDMLRVVTAAGVALPDAVAAMHAPQARVLGLGEWHMRPGDPAHVTVLGDDLSVQQAWRGGVRAA